MSFAVSGFKAIAQNFISQGLASNFYGKLPFLHALGAFDIAANKKDTLGIGRPSGDILSGKTLSPAERLELGTVNGYQPRIQRGETNNTKVMAKYDTMPVVAAPQTNAHSHLTQEAALFYFTEFTTPILIWHKDKERAGRAGTQKGRAIGMAKLIDEATEIAWQDHVKRLNTAVWTGNPTNQASDPWDDLLGIAQVMSSTNTYGNVDRTVEAVWQAKTDATARGADIVALLDHANLTQGLRIFGPGANLCVTTVALYQKFKAQIRAAGGAILNDGIPNAARMGYRSEALQFDNCFIVYDPTCPASNVNFFTMSTWRAAFRPGKNLTVTPFTDISQASEGAKKADQAFITTEMMLSCDNPALNAIYTNVS